MVIVTTVVDPPIPDQNFLNYMQFLRKPGKFVCSPTPPRRGWRPSYGKSWIRPCYATIIVYLHTTPAYPSPWSGACYVMITVDRGSTSRIVKIGQSTKRKVRQIEKAGQLNRWQH